jgi:hypothetical protein
VGSTGGSSKRALGDVLCLYGASPCGSCVSLRGAGKDCKATPEFVHCSSISSCRGKWIENVNF